MSIPTIEADAPHVMWAIDFPFDSTHRRQCDQDRLHARYAHPVRPTMQGVHQPNHRNTLFEAMVIGDFTEDHNH